MIYINGTEMNVKGDMLLTVGAEFVQIIGYIHDVMEQATDKKAAEEFINFCVDAALYKNLSEDQLREMDEELDAFEAEHPEMSFDEKIKTLVPDLKLGGIKWQP